MPPPTFSPPHHSHTKIIGISKKEQSYLGLGIAFCSMSSSNKGQINDDKTMTLNKDSQTFMLRYGSLFAQTEYYVVYKLSSYFRQKDITLVKIVTKIKVYVSLFPTPPFYQTLSLGPLKLKKHPRCLTDHLQHVYLNENLRRKEVTIEPIII